ncbi:MAG: RNB domain-containing ribonuclease, partial [Acidaminococcaceae bacterium]
IIRIVTHANNKVVGTFEQNGEFGFVVPDDKRIGQDIYIARKNFSGAVPQQKVVAEIIAWPSDHKNAEGKIIEVLGNVGDVGLEILSIIKQNDLPLVFPEAVLNASKRIPKLIKEADLVGRRDVRKLPIVTIDGDDAKDLDDAVYVQKRGQDYLLGVYIADVSHYVKEDAILDKEAKERGTSVYLVDRVLPMLPERLSN